MGRERPPKPDSELGKRYASWILSPTQVRELRRACRDNGARLVDDARLLHRRRRYATAYVLGYFALEELAKARILIGMQIAVEDGQPINWVQFWTHWKHHEPKSIGAAQAEHLERTVRSLETAAEMMLANLIHEGRLPDVVAKAEELRTLREAALYVGWSGSLATPASSITADLSAEMVAIGVRTLRRQDRLDRGLQEDPTRVRRIMRTTKVIAETWEAQTKGRAKGSLTDR